MDRGQERLGKGGAPQLGQKELSDLVESLSSGYRWVERDVAQQLRDQTKRTHSRGVVAAPARLRDVHARVREVATAGEGGGIDDEGPRPVAKR